MCTGHVHDIHHYSYMIMIVVYGHACVGLQLLSIIELNGMNLFTWNRASKQTFPCLSLRELQHSTPRYLLMERDEFNLPRIKHRWPRSHQYV